MSDLAAFYIVVNTSPPLGHCHPPRFAMHRSYASAALESQRLAREHAGQEFTVFCAVSSALREDPVTVRRYVQESEIPF